MSILSKLKASNIPLIEFAVPFLFIPVAACLSPNFLSAAFADPFGIWLLGAMFLWNCIGLVLGFVFPFTFVRVIAGLIFSLPLCTLSFFIPSLVNALHGCVNVNG